jgi:maltose O-acetyltransferase
MVTMALRVAGLRIGHGSLFYSVPTLVGPGVVQRNLRIGDFCGFNKGCYFDLEASIAIGDHVAVGHDVAFITTGCENGPPAQRGGRPMPAPIVVGDGVWLGSRSTVLPGVTIGTGSVIGAGVTVDQNVPAQTLVSGARPVSIARWR